jgi:uncharacterized protein YchJ
MACVGGGTQLSYADCCLPLHEGREAARDPVSLMRARYAAYVKRLPGFLVDTTHRENNDREGGTLLEETQAICKFVTFQKLTLLATENRGDEVRAEGGAAYRARSSYLWPTPPRPQTERTERGANPRRAL